MVLQAIYEKKEDVPDQYTDLYTEREGKWVVTGIEGVKTQVDVDKLEEAAREERKDHKATKEKLVKWHDLKMSPDEVHKQLDRIPELEASAGDGKPDEAKMATLVEARVEKLLRPVERERDGFKKDLEERDGIIGTMQLRENTRTIHDSVRAAAIAAKVIPEAMPDVLMLAERAFEVDEGSVKTKDGYEAATWLTEMQKTRSHWWPESRGSGAGGSGAGGFAENPFSRDHWNMTKQGQILKENPTRAAQMAKAAGTEIGKGMPPEKK